MKEDFNPREALGLTQSQLALLLNVSRSHWAMYELGKRDLPTSAFLALGEMLAYAPRVDPKAVPKTEHQLKQEEKLQVSLQKLVKESEFQLEHVVRKLAPLERKYQAHLKAQQLVAYLRTKNPEANERDAKLYDLINTKATRGVTHKMLLQRIKWQIKLEMLQAEKRRLEELIANGEK